MANNLQNTRIEFHILHSFPVSCLNRDDVGAPKSALIGGTNRARVSSQCWKRAIRLAMHELGVNTAVRTRQVMKFVSDACREIGADETQALACGEATAKALTKSVKEGESDTIFYISHAEALAVAEFFKANAFDATKDTKELTKILKKGLNTVMDGVDIALFGRMAASAPEVNVEASASFAHAISTHKVDTEIDFFTALDDINVENNIQGSAHMGSLEFNSATYYRYISLDLGLLAKNLGDAEDLTPAIDAFTKALFIAIPGGHQSTMTATTLWDYARIVVRKGQRVQASFSDAVRAHDGKTILGASIKKLDAEMDRMKTGLGSLYGEIASVTFGDGENGGNSENNVKCIDDVAKKLVDTVRMLQGN
ncbi:MAG: type I-E CRISPR-associated protein Cas7/Cse4/CasC [Planctomycetia bacterium]|nr:type I-E CRISPR-associated protein Cas7/Cse4/CasC [Planctomycetia bacterium]